MAQCALQLCSLPFLASWLFPTSDCVIYIQTTATYCFTMHMLLIYSMSTKSHHSSTMLATVNQLGTKAELQMLHASPCRNSEHRIRHNLLELLGSKLTLVVENLPRQPFMTTL